MDSYLQRLQDAISSATRGMDAAALTRHAEGKWSAAQVLEHLYLTYAGSVKGFERCLQEGRPLAGTVTFKEQLATLLVTELGYFPEGRKAPELTIPRGMAAEEVVKAIGEKLAVMDEIITQCETRFGRSTRILDHPVLGPLTVRQWRKFHLVHALHHMKQIWKLRGQT
ncbi:MAG: DUF1569 domain-containing protein [Terriglobales bacterium]|jgi:uncharacterized protein DUF1569